jgi:S-adenosylmethionine:tRNA ribosyltransferase-isomerase
VKMLPRSADKIKLDTLDFTLPPELEASEPPEARGLARDQVKLMVSYRTDDRVVHSQFRELGQFLQPGDVLVINTSGTLNAALHASDTSGKTFELHLSTRLPSGLWVVELREPCDGMTKPFYTAQAGQVYTLSGGGQAMLCEPYSPGEKVRLWIAQLELPMDHEEYLKTYGFPIRYSYVPQSWGREYYQTVYANEMGSAEMPSAGRAFTADLIMRLVARGIVVVPLILHTGVASLEDHEPPYAEYYRVPEATAQIINLAYQMDHRVIAVGTTVIRALETVIGEDGFIHAGEGWTDVIITPERGIHAVDGLLTGMHEPRATHLAMLEALASRSHLQTAYQEALEQRYLWHEFGDLHLILP